MVTGRFNYCLFFAGKISHISKMGNVSARSPRSNQDKLDVPVLIEPKVEPTRRDDHPGTMETFNKLFKDMQPLNFDGGKLVVKKHLSHHFFVTHALNIGGTATGGYHFGANYIGTKKLSEFESYPVVLSDIDTSGNLNANVIHKFSPNFLCKFASQIQNQEISYAQLTVDYQGSDYSTSVTVGNPNILNGSVILVGQYLQAVTKRLAVGSELMYQSGLNVKGGEIGSVSGAIRYQTADKETWSLLLGTNTQFGYHRRINEQIQLAVELERNFLLRNAIGRLSYQFDLPAGDTVFRGMIDTNWNVGGVLEKQLKPLPFTFELSAVINHVKNQFKVGVGMTIG